MKKALIVASVPNFVGRFEKRILNEFGYEVDIAINFRTKSSVDKLDNIQYFIRKSHCINFNRSY